MVVKPEIVELNKTGIQMKNIDLDDKNNLLDVKNVVIDFGAETIIDDLKPKDMVRVDKNQQPRGRSVDIFNWYADKIV